jgi:hypothetical protein
VEKGEGRRRKMRPESGIGLEGKRTKQQNKEARERRE